jgi:hypothetical protein
VNIPSLEQDVIPFALLDEVEHITHIKLLLSWCLVILVDLAEHAHDGEKSILLELILQFQFPGKVLLKQLVLNEGESCRVEFLDELVY